MTEKTTKESVVKPSFFQEIKDIGLVILLLVALVYFALNVLVGVIDVIEFSSVKECQPEETGTADCYKFADAKIISLYTEGRRRPNRYIKLLRDDRKEETSQMHYQDFWESLTEGDSVRVQIWQGTIRQIQKGDKSAPTALYPKFDLSNISLDSIVFRLIIFGGVSVALCFWFFDRRKRKT